MVSTVNWFGSSVGDTFNLHCEQLQLLHYTMTALNEKLYMDILYIFFFFFLKVTFCTIVHALYNFCIQDSLLKTVKVLLLLVNLWIYVRGEQTGFFLSFL